MPSPSMDRVRLTEHDVTWSDEKLQYGGVPVEELVCRTGTPAFVYLESRIRQNYRRFVTACALPPWGREVFYSAKTAPEPRLFQLLSGMGAHVEVASLRELDLALRHGFDASRIMLDGPVHTPEVVTRAVGRGVRRIKVDSPDQLRMLAEVAPGRPLDILVRLRAPQSRLAQSPAEGLITRFGMRPADLVHAWKTLRAHPHFRLEGVAIHVGSQIAGTAPYRRALAILARAAREAWEENLQPTALDVGGGFPSLTLRSPSFIGAVRMLMGKPQTPPLDAYGEALREALATAQVPPTVSSLIVEPGRALVGPAAVLLTRVVAVKGPWVFLDASRNFVPESLLFANRVFLPARWGTKLVRQNLSGCTLSGGDVLAVGARLPRCAVGDVLVMLDGGAYTLSKASRFTTPLPAAYIITAGGAIELMRATEKGEG